MTVDDLVKADLGCKFLPHGLGHLIGCDTHDVGGYIDGTPNRADDIKVNLRTARVLEANMVLTNEPGCYFIDVNIDAVYANPEQAKFVDKNVLERFRGFGGVRLEDVVLVTENGPENLTVCPRTVEEVESVCAGGSWPPMKDDSPELKRCWVQMKEGGMGMEKVNI